jgi:hypothetical protein
MLHYAAGDDKYRGLPDGNGSKLRLPDYRFGRGWRSALGCATSYLKNLIQSIAEAKLRRMQRELELCGIRFDGPSEEWIPQFSAQGQRSQIGRSSYMAILSRLASGIGSLSRRAVSALLQFLFPSWYEEDRKYWPEKHYMRGPGPKWCAKHPSEGASSRKS